MLRLIQILEREIRGGMALLGAATIKDLKPELVGPLDEVSECGLILGQVDQVNFQPVKMVAKL